jgi:hypothetical protein
MNATVENTDMSKLDWAKQSLAHKSVLPSLQALPPSGTSGARGAS